MKPRPPSATRTDTRVPETTRSRSQPHSRPSSNSGVGHQPILEAVRSGAAKGFALVPSEEDGRSYLSAWHTLADLPLVVTVSIAEADAFPSRSEEHTSELQSLMRISYAVFCLKNKNKKQANK